MAKKKDFSSFINMKFGSLTILEIKHEPKKVLAKCQCDCGNITEATVLSRLINGITKTCKTCSNKANGNIGRKSKRASSKYNALIGKAINYFFIERRADVSLGEPCGTFKCRCICGNIRFLDANELSDKADRKSCGCQQSRLLSLAGGGTGIPYENITVNEFIRKNTIEYVNWVSNCMKLNKYTCFISGQVGGTLNVHHIIPLSELIELYGITKENYKLFNSKLFDLNNGIVLSEEVHKTLHKEYGTSIGLPQIIAFKTKYNQSKP